MAEEDSAVHGFFCVRVFALFFLYPRGLFVLYCYAEGTRKSAQMGGKDGGV